MRVIAGLFLFFALFSSCGKDDALTVVLPKSYFPAYPGSYWYYTNGEISLVYGEYVGHSYRPSITSTGYTDTKLVPFIDQKYLYEYKITQNSTEYPLKQLVSESAGAPWIVNTVNGEIIYRETISKLDSLYLNTTITGTVWDTTFKNVLVVVEYANSLNNAQWNIKEYYAQNVGLIQTEVNNPYDTLPAVIQKQLYKYHINQ